LGTTPPHDGTAPNKLADDIDGCLEGHSPEQTLHGATAVGAERNRMWPHMGALDALHQPRAHRQLTSRATRTRTHAEHRACRGRARSHEVDGRLPPVVTLTRPAARDLAARNLGGQPYRSSRPLRVGEGSPRERRHGSREKESEAVLNACPHGAPEAKWWRCTRWFWGEVLRSFGPCCTPKGQLPRSPRTPPPQCHRQRP